MSSPANIERTTRTPRPPAMEPLRVNGITAAHMMGVSKTTFYERVKDGTYPPAGTDGLWSVKRLRDCSDRLDSQEPEPT